jgi:hypothetical protein
VCISIYLLVCQAQSCDVTQYSDVEGNTPEYFSQEEKDVVFLLCLNSDRSDTDCRDEVKSESLRTNGAKLCT